MNDLQNLKKNHYDLNSYVRMKYFDFYKKKFKLVDIYDLKIGRFIMNGRITLSMHL